MNTCRVIIFCLSLILSNQDNANAQNTVKQDSFNIDAKEQSLSYKDLVLGKFNYKNNEHFIKVNKDYSSKTIYLNTEVYHAFCNMHDQAKVDGFSLKIISGTRSFNEQKAIWERKWNKYKNLEPIARAKKILEYSAMPSTSRHHWGTELDLNSLSNSYFNNGPGKKEYEWLLKNAHKYGFYQVYTPKETGRTGYNLEKWHWSYLPLASKYLDFYNNNITYDDIINFKGSELAEKLTIIAGYVNGIPEQLKRYANKSSMKIILHPTYLPKIAHFVAMVNADEIIFEMEDSFLKQTYRNRAYIYGANGKLALNIPVVHSQKNRQKYRDVKIFNEEKWQDIHWKSLLSAYSTSPFFEYYEDEIQPLFTTKSYYILDYNLKCFEVICNCLQLELNISKTETYQKTIEGKTDFRYLVNAKKETPQMFDNYTQVFNNKHGFLPNLSILDLLFNEGPNALNYLESQTIIPQ